MFQDVGVGKVPLAACSIRMETGKSGSAGPVINLNEQSLQSERTRQERDFGPGLPIAGDVIGQLRS